MFINASQDPESDCLVGDADSRNKKVKKTVSHYDYFCARWTELKKNNKNIDSCDIKTWYVAEW